MTRSDPDRLPEVLEAWAPIGEAVKDVSAEVLGHSRRSRRGSAPRCATSWHGHFHTSHAIVADTAGSDLVELGGRHHVTADDPGRRVLTPSTALFVG